MRTPNFWLTTWLEPRPDDRPANPIAYPRSEGRLLPSRRKHVIIAASRDRVASPAWDEGEMERPHEMHRGEFIRHLLDGNLTDAGLAMRGLHVMARTQHMPASLLPVREEVRGLLALA